MLKERVRDYWERESCGEVYAEGRTAREQLAAQARARYELEPYLAPFARFEDAKSRSVLEIGVGMGADHLAFAHAEPALLVGVDLTGRALSHTAARLRDHGFQPRLLQTDAEHLPFRDGAFDLVFSWGVLHHTPDIVAALAEVHRVLVPGGHARMMLYHRQSVTVDILWLRYGLAAGRPWRSRRSIVAEHLESPGTQAFTRGEVEALFARFASARVQVQLAFTDLLEGAAGQRHQGALLSTARKLWPRRFLRTFARNRGFNLLIDAVK